MLFGCGTVAMVWKDAANLQRQRGGATLRQLRGRGIKNVRWEVNKASIAGEQIGAEQQSQSLAIKSHVPVGVAGKMDCAESLPYVDQVAIVQPAVGNERMKL